MGFPPLCVNLPVWSHAHLVRLVFPFTHLPAGNEYKYTVAVCFLNSAVCADLTFIIVCRPDGALYQMFRNQFLSYNLYQSKIFTLFSNSSLRACELEWFNVILSLSDLTFVPFSMKQHELVTPHLKIWPCEHELCC